MPAARGFHYTEQAGPAMTPHQVMALANKYGLPARGIMQIAKGESGLRPQVQQHDPGDGMVGYGLLQMTPNAWGQGSAAYRYMQKLGGVQAMADPDKNMAMARFLYKAAGNSFKPWYGTKFLTDRAGEGSLGPVRGGTGGGSLPGARTTTTTSPGTDNSAARFNLVRAFLFNKSADPLSFVTQFKALADIPGTSRTTTIPGSAPASTGSSAGQAGGSLAAFAQQRANVIDAQRLPYSWGGGHAGKTKLTDAVPLDCSGAVSKVLGIDPRVSGQFESWGKPGDGGGRGVTIAANSHHVIMKINGHWFGTSNSNPGGGAGWIPEANITPGYLSSFTLRHA